MASEVELRKRLNPGDPAGRPYDASRHLRHPLVIERIRRIACRMVMRVPQEAGVRHHQGRVTLVPKRTVIGQSYLRNLLRQRDRKQWEANGLHESATQMPRH